MSQEIWRRRQIDTQMAVPRRWDMAWMTLSVVFAIAAGVLVALNQPISLIPALLAIAAAIPVHIKVENGAVIVFASVFTSLCMIVGGQIRG